MLNIENIISTIIAGILYFLVGRFSKKLIYAVILSLLVILIHSIYINGFTYHDIRLVHDIRFEIQCVLTVVIPFAMCSIIAGWLTAKSNRWTYSIFLMLTLLFSINLMQGSCFFEQNMRYSEGRNTLFGAIKEAKINRYLPRYSNSIYKEYYVNTGVALGNYSLSCHVVLMNNDTVIIVKSINSTNPDDQIEIVDSITNDLVKLKMINVIDRAINYKREQRNDADDYVDGYYFEAVVLDNLSGLIKVVDFSNAHDDVPLAKGIVTDFKNILLGVDNMEFQNVIKNIEVWGL